MSEGKTDPVLMVCYLYQVLVTWFLAIWGNAVLHIPVWMTDYLQTEALGRVVLCRGECDSSVSMATEEADGVMMIRRSCWVWDVFLVMLHVQLMKADWVLGLKGEMIHTWCHFYWFRAKSCESRRSSLSPNRVPNVMTDVWGQKSLRYTWDSTAQFNSHVTPKSQTLSA